MGKYSKTKKKHSLKPKKGTLKVKQSVLTPTLYSTKTDRTLTKGQGEAGYFRNISKGGSFRTPSNKTLSGYSTGYHEAAVTTDTFKFLRDAKLNKDGTQTLPKNAPKNSFWKKFTKQKVNSKNTEFILNKADGFRTDTARTILSAPGGRAAGHSGSGLNTEGQAAAHDLLRKAVWELLKVPPKTKGFSERSVALILASITVTSIAPGEIARTVKGGTGSLKAGDIAKKNYEANRTETKRRVEYLYNALTPQEQQFVDMHVRLFMDRTQEGVPVNKRRKIPPKRATSPERGRGIIVPGEVAGSGYLKPSPLLKPLKLPPIVESSTAMYVTEHMRDVRR